MTTTTNNQTETFTDTALSLAIRRAEAMHSVYHIEAIALLPGRFYVQHKEEVSRCYIVDNRTESARCSCPAFDKSGICKHMAFCHEVNRIEEMEEAQMWEDYGDYLVSQH